MENSGMKSFRRNSRLALTLGVILVQLCPGCFVGPGRLRNGLEYDGIERRYLLHLPPSHSADQRWPLVVALHPFAATGAMMARTTGFDSIADEEGFVVCYPQGLTFLWNGDPTDEPKGLLVEDADDVEFIDRLLNHLIERYAVDSSRIYVVGASNGGLMAQRLACELGDRLAAVAPVMITMPEGFPERCENTSEVPMLMILGTDDPFFPWEGGVVQHGPSSATTYLSAERTVDFWVERNRAASEPEVEALPDLDPDDGTRIYREVHAADESGAEFVFYRVEGGGHTWPGSSSNLLESFAGVGRISQDMDASRVIWDFFKTKSR